MNRRDFIKSSGLILGSVHLNDMLDFGSSQSVLRVGLVGCGGRGVGAAAQALAADPHVHIVALADVFDDQIENALHSLSRKDLSRVQVPKERKFVGFDAYKRLIDQDIDVVLLCSPPNFRPDHLAYAVQKGVHIFCEKPMAVDIPGLKQVMDSVRLSKVKNLSIVSGFCFRYLHPNREIISRVEAGQIGDIKSVNTFRFGGDLSIRKRTANMTELEYQLRNWYYYQRYAGDLIVEQSIHSVDYMNWVMQNNLPKSVHATGGRQSRDWNGIGNTYDHFAVEYDYGNGIKGTHFARQQNGTESRNSVDILGSKGYVEINMMSNYAQHGESSYQWKGQQNNMYQTQHDELFAAIRANKMINDGDFMVNSTLLAIWGKVSAYTGKRLTLEQIMNSQEKLGPSADDYSWDMKPDELPIVKTGLKPFI